MPMTPKERKTKAAYNARPENVKKREENNRARQAALRAGTARVGDATNVDHIKPLDEGGAATKANTRVVSEHFNKGWRKRQPRMYGKNS